MNIISELEDYMEDNNINQRQLANLLDINEQYLSRLLNDNASPGAKIYKKYFELPGIMEKEYQEKKIRQLKERIKDLERDRDYFEQAINDLERNFKKFEEINNKKELNNMYECKNCGEKYSADYWNETYQSQVAGDDFVPIEEAPEGTKWHCPNCSVNHGPVEVEKVLNRKELISKLKEAIAIEREKEWVLNNDPQVDELFNCDYGYIKYLFYSDEIRYLPDGNEPHPLKFDKWKNIKTEELEKYYNEIY